MFVRASKEFLRHDFEMRGSGAGVAGAEKLEIIGEIALTVWAA